MSVTLNHVFNDYSSEFVGPAVPQLPTKHHDLHELYSAVKIKSYITDEIDPHLAVIMKTEEGQMMRAPTVKSSLLEKLRPYQLEAVKWMIAREKG